MPQHRNTWEVLIAGICGYTWLTPHLHLSPRFSFTQNLKIIIKYMRCYINLDHPNELDTCFSAYQVAPALYYDPSD